MFRLHDTYGFPREMTERAAAPRTGSAIEGEFEALMAEQRERGRGVVATATGGGGPHAETDARGGYADTLVGELLARSEPTASPAMRPTEQRDDRRRRSSALGDGEGRRFLVKLAESPFYAPGGGQVADTGTIECEDGDCRATVTGVLRRGEDQLVEVRDRGGLAEGGRARARARRPRAPATRPRRTTPRPTCFRRRCASGSAATSARPAPTSGPDKLRFDFSHGQGLSAEELRDVEDRVNEWIAGNDPVRAITTTLDEARALGAMALFGEKYGEVVRMVEVGGGEHSRELCGGTHVRRTGEIGPFRILSETSSAANVRRIEAVTGPAAVELLRDARRHARGDRRRAARRGPSRRSRRYAGSPRSAAGSRRSWRQRRPARVRVPASRS